MYLQTKQWFPNSYWLIILVTTNHTEHYAKHTSPITWNLLKQTVGLIIFFKVNYCVIENTKLVFSWQRDHLYCYHERTKGCFFLLPIMFIRDEQRHASMQRWRLNNFSNCLKLKMSDQARPIIDQHNKPPLNFALYTYCYTIQTTCG